MMVDYLGADHVEAFEPCRSTRGAHAKFSWLAILYGNNFEMAKHSDADDLWVAYHRECALRCFIMFLVGTSMLVEKSENYVDVAYLKYSIDLNSIHEWN